MFSYFLCCLLSLLFCILFFLYHKLYPLFLSLHLKIKTLTHLHLSVGNNPWVVLHHTLMPQIFHCPHEPSFLSHYPFLFFLFFEDKAIHHCRVYFVYSSITFAFPLDDNLSKFFSWAILTLLLHLVKCMWSHLSLGFKWKKNCLNLSYPELFTTSCETYVTPIVTNNIHSLQVFFFKKHWIAYFFSRFYPLINIKMH